MHASFGKPCLSVDKLCPAFAQRVFVGISGVIVFIFIPSTIDLCMHEDFTKLELSFAAKRTMYQFGIEVSSISCL